MKSINHVFLTLFFILLPYWAVIAQDDSLKYKNSFSFGGNFNYFDDNSGAGLNISTPYFFDKLFALRLSANSQRLNYIPKDNNKMKTGVYQNIKFGFVLGGNGQWYKKRNLKSNIRAYLEFGTVCLFPNSEFSGKDYEFGQYSLLGCEFILARDKNTDFSFFTELGHIGRYVNNNICTRDGFRADRAVNEPYYSEGVSISYGIRVWIKK